MAEQGVTEKLYAHVAEHGESSEYSEAERLAIEYAERFALDHLSLDDTFFKRMREHFTAATCSISLSASGASWRSVGSPKC